MRKSAFVFLFVLSISLVNAQIPFGNGGNRTGAQQMTGSFYGKLIDSVYGKPIEFASVQLIQNKYDSASKKRKDVVISGMLTKANGEFNLPNIPLFGQYKLHITVIGFKPYTAPVSFSFRPGGAGNANSGNNGTPDPTALLGALDKDLGNIKLQPDEKMLSNVTVTASKPGLQLAIDKKVFNVEKNITSTGGTAVDVMRNVPSLNVDIDGNVTLRNNAPQIFVDGRPTTMTLDQIPADAIESVEIITNPSAKYDASGGTSGILNIILKKNKKAGYNGNVRMNADSRGKVGGGADINIRQDKVNFSLSGNFFPRKSISDGTTDRLTLIGTPNTRLKQIDHNVSTGHFEFFRGGFDYLLSNRNTFSINGNYGRGKFKPYTSSDIYIDSLYNPVTSSFNDRISNTIGNFRNLGTQFSYTHNFPKAGHILTADVTYNKSKNDNQNMISTDYFTVPQNLKTGTFSQQQQINGTNNNLIIQSDYSNPITDKSKIEAGVRAAIRNTDSRNDYYNFDASNNPVYNPLLSVNYTSKDEVYAAYTTFSNQVKSLGYQIGLRAESSNYVGHLPDKNQDFKTSFPISLFPSFFLSEKFKKNQELQLNYTRRINRPNFFQLYPFTDYSDSLNVSRGNPDLKPEFTNSFELSYQKMFKKNGDNFLGSIYYKRTNDLITRYQVQETSIITGNPTLVNTYINANSSYVTGVELIQKLKMTKWWDLTANLNIYTSKINIDDPTQPKQDQFASWFSKINNTFKLPSNFTLQVSGDYQSKTILPPGGSGASSGGRGGFGGMFGQATASQGYVRATYGVDAAIKYDFLKDKKASLSLNVNDIFRTRKSDIHSESAYFIQDAFRRRDAQIFRLNFNLRFGKFDVALFKRKDTKNQTEGMDNMNMGGGQQ